MILLSLSPPELFSYLGVVRASRSEVIDRKVDNKGWNKNLNRSIYVWQ